MRRKTLKHFYESSKEISVSKTLGIIDAHAHLKLQQGAVAELLKRMDLNGIEKTVVVAGGTITPDLLSQHFSHGGSSDVTVDNEAIWDACEEAKGRLLPFFFANPIHGPETYRQKGRRFFGLKLAPIVHGLPFSDDRMQRLIEVAVEFNHPIYLHCLPRTGFEVADVVTLAKRNPGASIILGHGGVGHGDFHGISQIAKQTNIYFEASGTFTHATRVAWKVLGASRVLYGSEYPLQDQSVEIQKFACLEIDAEERLQIMRTNTLKLLGLTSTNAAESRFTESKRGLMSKTNEQAVTVGA